MKIRNYTLNFVKLGKPVNNQYPIYIRYYYTLNQKKCTYDYNCDTLLSKEQFQLLKENSLLDITALELQKQKEDINQHIKSLYFKNSGEYPTIEILKEHLTIGTQEIAIESLIDNFIDSHKYTAKKISLKKYREQLKHLTTYVLLHPSYFNNFDDLVNIKTIKHIERYLDAKAILKSISNNTFKNIISMTVLFLNYVADKYNIPKIDYKVKIPLLSEKIHITEDEFVAMVSYDVGNSGLRKDHRANLKQTQDILYINSFIGLRINELLKIKKANITFNDGHISIKFLEQKKSDIREVVILDNKAITLISHYCYKSNDDYLFNMYVNVFNNNLKALARLSGMTEPFEYIKKYRTDDVTLSKPKWKLISSHSIRRYAVNQNVARYGIDIARQFSGHKDYSTIKNNYMRNINEQELLKRLKSENKKA